jgi:hypothetical protein
MSSPYCATACWLAHSSTRSGVSAHATGGRAPSPHHQTVCESPHDEIHAPRSSR